MKLWKNLAQIFFGILSGYLLSNTMLFITQFSFVGLAAIGLSSGNGGSSFITFLIAIGVLLFGLACALLLGLGVNAILMVFLPISGFISSFITVMTILYFIFKVVASFIF